MQTTTATRTTTETNVNLAIRYDPTYFKTIPGILKCVCVVLSLLGFICIQASSHSHLFSGGFFNTIAMVAFWFSGLLLALYVFHGIERFFKIPWIQVELGFCAIWTLLYLIASIMAATVNSGAYTTAAFFGFCAMIAYGYDAWLKFNAHRSGEIAQGQRVVSQTVITQQTPSAFPA